MCHLEEAQFSNLEKASWWQRENAASCHHLHLPFTSGCMRSGVHFCQSCGGAARGQWSVEKWVGSWVHQWQILRLNIMKQKIKVPCCQNFQGQQCCSLSFQLKWAWGPSPAASCVFPDWGRVSALVKPILGRLCSLPKEIEMSVLACLQARVLNFGHDK